MALKYKSFLVSLKSSLIKRYFGINTGLEIGHFCKNSNSRKLKTQGKNSNSSKKRHKKIQAIKLFHVDFTKIIKLQEAMENFVFPDKCSFFHIAMTKSLNKSTIDQQSLQSL